MTVLQSISVGRSRLLGRDDGRIDRFDVVAVGDDDHVPAVGLEALAAYRR